MTPGSRMDDAGAHYDTSVFDEIARQSVLVVGDVILDEHLWGSPAALPREADAPVVRIETSELVLGGAGNTAANVVGLGAQTHLVAATGPDDGGEAIRELAAQLGARGHFVMSTNRPTTRKTRVHSGASQLVRFDREVAAPVAPAEGSQIARLGVELLEVVDVLIISDYAKGTVTEDVACALVTEARRRDVIVVVDTKSTRPSSYRGCTAVTPQVRELESWAGRKLTPQEYAAEARTLAERLEGCLILVTEGEDGMTLFSDETSWHLPVRTRGAVSSIGAGDTVVAAFALGLAAGLAPIAAASLASDAAAAVVQQPGTRPVSVTALRGMSGKATRPSRVG